MTFEPLCCAFTYDSNRDWGVTRTALGIARSWVDLSREFFRQGPPCPAIKTVHFQTISIVGPKLFAVSLETFKVFYHDGDRWYQYQSARNVRLGRFKDFMEFFHENDDDTNADDWSQQERDGNDRDNDGDDLGRQVKDASFSSNSTHKIDQTILYYCIL